MTSQMHVDLKPSAREMSRGNVKIYQGVRVKATVKQLLKERRNQQRNLRLTMECTSFFHDADTASFLNYNLYPQPEKIFEQPSYMGNTTNHMAEMMLYHDFSTTHQVEPVDYREQDIYPLKQPLESPGNVFNHDKRQTLCSPMDPWSQLCTEDIRPLETHPLAFSQSSCSCFGSLQMMDLTCGSHLTNYVPYDSAVYTDCGPPLSVNSGLPDMCSDLAGALYNG